MKYKFSVFFTLNSTIMKTKVDACKIQLYKQFGPRTTFDFTKTLQFSYLVKAIPVSVKRGSSLLVYWAESTPRHGADKVHVVT